VRSLVDHRHGATRASLCEVTLPADRVSRPVWHRRVEEIWYLLEGHGQVWRRPPGVDPDAVAPVPVAPGDALTIPVGWRFQFSAGPGGPLRFLCYTSPPWPGPDEAGLAEHGGLGEATV
jgi:mannose-6-phosphate isomerase-like protein (cupin superfamily)